MDTESCLAAIAEHSRGFADAAERDLDAPVWSCPGWDVAELVWHLTEVHWFWATIAGERLPEPPGEERRPARAERAQLIEVFRTGAERMVSVLRDADQTATAWTWAPRRQDVAFITRHQVQEAAVHHWDAANATGAEWRIDPVVAADCVDEFLHFSLASNDFPADPPTRFEGTLAIRCTDAAGNWTLADGDRPGTLAVTEGTAEEAPTLAAPAGELLLWLYKRKDIDSGDVPPALLERFRSLTFTD